MREWLAVSGDEQGGRAPRLRIFDTCKNLIRTLPALRQRLDELDAELTALFARRQALARRIGGVKREQGLPVCDPERERQVLASRGDLLPERRRQVERLFALLMELSREAQT